VGTPAVTARGMGEPEMREIGALIADAIERRDDPSAHAALAARVGAITGRFPVPGLDRPA
jgi:glycine hydroxymethyltransferase